MILCFSATGNSRAAAEAVAHATGDVIVDLGARYKTGDFDLEVEQGESLGWVFPVYAWSTPGIVDDFIRKAKFHTPSGETYAPDYCYCVISCGSQVGDTASFLSKILDKYQGISLDASFNVKSVGNCVYLYSPATGEKREKLLADAAAKEKAVAQAVAAKQRVHREHKGALGRIISKMTCREEKPRGIEPFHTLPSCIGCGTCVKNCPTNTIHMENGQPVWSGTDCTQCLACVHLCPNQAAQFGKKTEGRPRYKNPILSKNK